MELLERDHELGVLRHALQNASHGRGSVVAISGEAGIGKTRLVEEFVRGFGDGPRVVWGRCDDLTTPRVLGPFREIGDQLGVASVAALSPGSSQTEFYARMLDALDAGIRGTVAILEDVHWADAASLDMLKYLGRRAAHSHALILITFRDTETSPDHPLRVVLGTLSPDDLHRLHLSPLSETAVADLAERAGGGHPDAFRLTGGNPFLLHELFCCEPELISANVLDAVATRLAALPDDARRVAEVVALVPGRCERSLVDATAPASPAALEECQRRGLLEYNEQQVWFRHELARRAAEHTLAALRRQELHAAILAALVDRPIDAARLVHHAEGANDPEALLKWALAAAHEARAMASHREAVAHYRRTIPYVHRLEPQERADLLADFAEECYLNDEQQDALRAADQALLLYRDLGERERIGAMLRWVSRVRWWMGDGTGAEAAGAEAIEVLEGLPPGRELAMAYSNKAQLHMLAHELGPAEHWAVKAIDTARSVDDLETLAHALNNLGSTRLRAGDLGGQDLLLESRRLALQEGFDEHAARAFSNFTWMALARRDYELAARDLEEGIAFCSERQMDGSKNYLVAQRAHLHLDLGEWDAALADATWVLAQPQSPGITTLPALTVLARIESRRGCGNAAATVSEMWKQALQIGEFQRLGPAAVVRAEFFWLRQDGRQAREAIEPAVGLLSQSIAAWERDEVDFWAWRTGLDQPSGSEQAAAIDASDPFHTQIAGDWKEAAERWDSLGCPYDQAMAFFDSNDPAALRQALGILDELGAVPAASLVRRALRDLGEFSVPRGPRRTTRSNPAGLTNRQLQVLALLTEGLSNAEIAARLFVSVKTVDHHVSAILSKLEVSSRTEAAQQAIERGLINPLPSSSLT